MQKIEGRKVILQRVFISWQFMNLVKTKKNIYHLGLTQNAEKSWIYYKTKPKKATIKKPIRLPSENALKKKSLKGANMKYVRLEENLVI